MILWAVACAWHDQILAITSTMSSGQVLKKGSQVFLTLLCSNKYYIRGTVIHNLVIIFIALPTQTFIQTTIHSTAYTNLSALPKFAHSLSHYC